MIQIGNVASATDDRPRKKPKPAKKKRRIWPILVLVACVLATAATVAISIWHTDSARAEHEKIMENLEEYLDDEKAKSKDIESSKNTTIESADTFHNALDEAAEKGQRLAEAQNGYQNVDGSTVSTYVNGELRPYFADSVRRSSFPWLSRLSEPYTWTFQEPLSIEEGGVPCVWTCRIGEDVIAYAFANYDLDAKTFCDVVRVRTNTLQKYVLAQTPSFLSEPDETTE